MGHTNELSQLRFDLTNKLFVTSGWDSMILVQKETKNGSEVKRTIKNAHFSKGVSLMEISV